MVPSEAVTLNLLLLTLGGFGAGAAGAVLAARRPAVSRLAGHACALIGAMAAFALGAAGLAGSTLHVTLPALLPIGGLSLGMDRLSAFFVLVIAVAAVPSAVYAIAYTRAYEGKSSLAGMGLGFNAFLAGMVLVALARNVLTFLVMWEAMSLASYFLVMTEAEHRETQDAGWLYLVTTHAGFACLLMAHGTGTMNLSEWRVASALLSSPMRNAVFVLLALGFGTKAGVVPLHIWLPKAHPAAPSHVSALMSGVMIKLGVYGLIRIGFDWLGVGAAWWGDVILVVAAMSAVLGVLYALVEQDLKCLLAYSSVENIGIILLGVGAGMLFQSYHLDALASLALVAGLYHAANHALFKPLLFMGAGAVVHATGTRNMEEMGGLSKRMPQTAVWFLVGAVAIAALPPFNGFISEWLMFQSLLLSFRISATGTNLLFALSIAALALTSGLAAACFVKAFGIAFLALPRSHRAEQAREAPRLMRGAMAMSAVACLALGVAPVGLLSLLNGIAAGLTGTSADVRFNWNGIVANDAFATVSPLWIAVTLVSLLALVPLALRIIGANVGQRAYETWGCGRALQTSRFEYTGTAFANPFKRVFGLLYRPVKELDIQFHPESRLFVETITYRNETHSIFEEALYGPISRLVQRGAQRARIVQSGNVHLYLLYIFAALIVLLALAG